MVAWLNLGRDFKVGNVKSLSVARGGGELKRSSINKMEFLAHSARSKMNPFTTQTSVVSSLRKGRWRREDEHPAADHVEIATHIHWAHYIHHLV